MNYHPSATQFLPTVSQSWPQVPSGVMWVQSPWPHRHCRLAKFQDPLRFSQGTQSWSTFSPQSRGRWKWVSGWLIDWLIDWLIEWVSEWVSEFEGGWERASEQANEWVKYTCDDVDFSSSSWGPNGPSKDSMDEIRCLPLGPLLLALSPALVLGLGLGWWGASEEHLRGYSTTCEGNLSPGPEDNPLESGSVIRGEIHGGCCFIAGRWASVMSRMCEPGVALYICPSSHPWCQLEANLLFWSNIARKIQTLSGSYQCIAWRKIIRLSAALLLTTMLIWYDFTHFFSDYCENMCTLFYDHHQIGYMNH